ncbi:hypothetical protein Chor_003632, partial [Crotalus horridus]
NGGYSHYNLISENNVMDMEMANSLGPVCRQNLLSHSGNSFAREHLLPCERLLQVSQLNMSCADTRPVFVAMLKTVRQMAFCLSTDRPLQFQDSADATTPCMNGSHTTQHIKQECLGDYKGLSEVSAHRGIADGMELKGSGGLHLDHNSLTNSLSSQLFNNEHSPSLGSLSLNSPHHSSRPQASNLKKRCISVLPSSADGIDITTIIRTSQTSLVTCVNGLWTNSAGVSSSPREITLHSAQKPSRPQSCSQSGNHCHIPSPSVCLVPVSSETIRGDCDYSPMQHTGENASFCLIMNTASAPQPDILHSKQKLNFLKQEPLDEYSSASTLFQHHQELPPPYHLHEQQSHIQGALTHLQASMSPKSLQMSEGDEQEASGGKQICRWIDCSAVYDQQDELVRHIEKTHIDQRKGEDFTCFWAGCVRRYKPFNARYKLLIHMRVHSGEKPNKCMVSLECIYLTGNALGCPLPPFLSSKIFFQ